MSPELDSIKLINKKTTLSARFPELSFPWIFVEQKSNVRSRRVLRREIHDEYRTIEKIRMSTRNKPEAVTD